MTAPFYRYVIAMVRLLFLHFCMTITSALSLLAPYAFAELPCVEQEVVSTLQSDSHPIKNWSMKEQNLSLQPEDILPESYLHDLREALGSVQINISYHPSVEAQLTAGGLNVAKLKLKETRAQPHALTVESLRLENPLATGGKLHSHQYSKGLPPSVFDFTKVQLFKITRAGGYNALRTAGAQTYEVNYLYRRGVGMKPENPKAEEFQKYLDQILKLSRNLPDEERFKSLDQFSAALSGAPKQVTNRWGKYLNSRVLPENMEILSLNGKPALLVDREQPVGKRVFVLRPPQLGRNIIFQWDKNLSDPERALTLSLTR